MSKMSEKLFKVDLQFFNDGGGATGGAEGSTATATENAPKTETKTSGGSRRSKSGEFDNVVFGKQEGTTATETTSLDTEGKPTGAGNTTPEDRQKAYDDFINEYKDIDQKRFQETFDRRFKQVKSMEAELASQKEVIDMLKGRYGVDDVAKLTTALKEDTEYWERVADEHGMTVEQFQAKQKLELENKDLRAFQQRQIGEMKARQQIEAWNEEAKAVKQMYPSFDLKKEVQNKAFMDLLSRGVNMEHAYKVVNFDRLNQEAAITAAKTADAQAQARIKQKASRPSENGTSSQSAAIVRNDVSTLTRAERAEIARRVARGEKIIF